MIQRIQTIFLLLTAIVVSLPFVFPVAQVFIPSDASYDFFAYGVREVGNEKEGSAYYWALLILYSCMVLLPVITIFLYKKRFLQFRLCVVEIILQIGSLVLMWIHIRHFTSSMQGAEIIYKTSFILPAAGIILIIMAIRGILNDIKLLKSYDRIR